MTAPTAAATSADAAAPGRDAPDRAVLIAVVVVLAVALAVRVAFVLATRDLQIVDDPADYHRLAQSVADGHGFGESVLTASGGPTAFRAPLYPFLLGVLYDVVGVSVTAARLVQAVLGVVTVGLIGLLGWRLFGRRAGFAAAAIAAVYPPLVLAGGSLLTESMSLPLVVGALLLALEHRRRGGLRWAVLAGLVTGIAVLTRENSAVLLAPLALLVWVGRPRFRLASLAAPAAVVAAAAVVVLPWTARNWARFDTVVPVTDSTGFVWAGVYNPDSAANDRFPAVFVAPVAVDSYRPLFADPELDEVELAAELQSRARHYARDHPSYVAKVIGWNTLRLFDLTGREFAHVVGASLGYSTRVSDAAVAGWYLVAALALVGLLVAPIRRTPLALWLAPLLFWGTTVLALGTYRYRAPIEPFVVCLAGCAVVAAHDRVRRRAA